MRETPEQVEEVQFYGNMIASNIRYYRRNMGISQEKLGELAGTSRQLITRLENYGYHESSCSWPSIVNIARALNVMPWELMQAKRRK